MRQRALVDIDLLLDTRYGTLKRIDEQVADALVATSVYRERHHDNFDVLTNGKISREQYQTLYAARDVETLAVAAQTDFVNNLRLDVLEGLSDMDRGVKISALEIDVNYYRYDLLPQEVEVIRRALQYRFPDPTVVNMVSKKPQTLTPKIVDRRYEMMAWYNHEDWLQYHLDALLEHPIPSNVLLTPMISSSGDVPEPDLEVRDPFLARSAIFVRHFALHYLKPEVACYNPVIPQLVHSLRQTKLALLEHPPQGSAQPVQPDTQEAGVIHVPPYLRP